MKTIKAYMIPTPKGGFKLEAPEGAEFFFADAKDDDPTIYALVDDENEEVETDFYIAEHETELPASAELADWYHVASFWRQMTLYHVFERRDDVEEEDNEE